MQNKLKVSEIKERQYKDGDLAITSIYISIFDKKTNVIVEEIAAEIYTNNDGKYFVRIDDLFPSEKEFPNLADAYQTSKVYMKKAHIYYTLLVENTNSLYY